MSEKKSNKKVNKEKPVSEIKSSVSSEDKVKVLTAKDLNLTGKYEKIDAAGFSVWVRALLQNGRQGTVGCKGRSEVSYSNKKPWKQKGTGRARAGSRRSPIWIGGGIIFGPQPRVRKLKVNKTLKKQILNNIVREFLENKKIFCLDWQTDKPKTSQAYELLKDSNLHAKKLVLLVEPNDYLTQASFANLQNVKLVLFDEANAYNLTSNNGLIVLKKNLDAFKEMVSQWT